MSHSTIKKVVGRSDINKVGMTTSKTPQSAVGTKECEASRICNYLKSEKKKKKDKLSIDSARNIEPLKMVPSNIVSSIGFPLNRISSKSSKISDNPSRKVSQTIQRTSLGCGTFSGARSTSSKSGSW